jgi:hypothetical protein
MIKRPVPLTLTARRTPSKLTYWRTLLVETAPTVNNRMKTYTAYSIGCAVVWAVILTVTATVASTDRKHTIYVFAGG